MAYHCKGIKSLMISGLMAVLGTGVASGEGFFDEAAEFSRPADRYEVPTWSGLDWRPSPAAEAALVGTGVSQALLAVASNFWDPREAPPKYVRAMALVLCRLFEPESNAVRLANYQLRYRRQPDPVPIHPDRAALARSLWRMAWRAHALSGGNPGGALPLLDLAASFDPSDEESMRRYQRLSANRMELRWSGAVRLPEGVDAPDLYQEPEPESEPPQPREPEAGSEEPAEPALFMFKLETASVLVPAVPGGDDRFVRLEAREVVVDPEFYSSAGAVGSSPGGNRLPVGFGAGDGSDEEAGMVAQELHRARLEFLRRRPGLEFPKDLGVRFELAGGGRARTELISAAAGVVLEAMARGVDLAPGAAAAGAVSFGSILQWEGSLTQVLIANNSLKAKIADGPQVMVAVPIFSEGQVAELAALGEFRLLMDLQLVGCRRVDDALAVVAAEPGEQMARAFALFAEIGRAAERIPPKVLLANPKVRARLGEVLRLCPQHLSAAQLYRVAKGDAAPASLASSVERLRLLEGQVRDLVQAHLQGELDAGDEADTRCALAQNALRDLRPRIDVRARPLSDRLYVLIGELRDSLRSKYSSSASHGGIATRRAEALRAALQTLEVEVATLSAEDG